MIRGVVISALEVVEVGLVVVDVATIAQRIAVDEAAAGWGGAGGAVGGYVTPRVVGVVALRPDRVGCISVFVRHCSAPKDHHHVALPVGRIIIGREIRSTVTGIADGKRTSRFVVAEIHDDLAGAGEEALAHQLAAARNIMVRYAVNDFLRPDTVGVVGIFCDRDAASLGSNVDSRINRGGVKNRASYPNAAVFCQSPDRFVRSRSFLHEIATSLRSSQSTCEKRTTINETASVGRGHVP